MTSSLKDGSTLQIRPANTNDASLILTFIRALAVYEKLEQEVTTTEELLRRNLFGENSPAEVLIATRNGEPAAFALFFQNFSTFLGRPGIYLEDLYVHEHLRGLGIGKILLTHIAKIAHERNCGRFEWSVLDWNQPAIDFYKSLGAKPMAEWTVYRLDEEAIENLVTEKSMK